MKIANNKWYEFDMETSKSYLTVDNSISIMFVQPTGISTIGQFASQIVAFEQQYNLQRVRSNIGGIYDYQTPVNLDILNVCDSVALSPLVQSISVNVFGEFCSLSNDPIYNASPTIYLAPLKKIKADSAWDITTGDSNLIIAVIDAGTNWEHPDLGPGTDGYQNIYLNSGEDTWADPNDPTTGNGLDDDHNGRIDDWKGWNFSNSTNDSRDPSSFQHGTQVAGLIGAKTHNNLGVAGIAGGWNHSGCKMLICKVGGVTGPNLGLVDDAIYYAREQGAKIISLQLSSTLYNTEIRTAIDQVVNSGLIVICSAGNGGTSVTFPANLKNVISVGATDSSSQRLSNCNMGADLDIAAPGLNLYSTIGNLNYFLFGETSASAPVVSGVVALMLSKNNCLRQDWTTELLKATAQKLKPSVNDYNWNPGMPGHSKSVGYGIVNAKAAVEAAMRTKKNTVDYMIRDEVTDIGLTDSLYGTGSPYDKGPDIWMRNQPDGYENQFHEAPVYSSVKPRYIYVRVRNKSCVDATNTGAKLRLYWSKKSSWASWPTHWNGTKPDTGNLITTYTIPAMSAGESRIFGFDWMLPNINTDSFKIHSCLLAQIEDCIEDPITHYPNRQDKDVKFNNNIAMRNLTIVKASSSPFAPPFNGDLGEVLVGNILDRATALNIHFRVPRFADPGTRDITQEAEVKLTFDNIGWGIMQASGQLVPPAFHPMEGNSVRVMQPDVTLHNVTFPAYTRIPVGVSVNFLTEEITENENYEWTVSQAFPNAPEEILGMETYQISKDNREPFYANAGQDRSINASQPTTFTAQNIGANATYNWYDSTGALIYTGTSMSLSPAITQRYKLEVIDNQDGFKDYDSVMVIVNHRMINAISPNPASTVLNVNYMAENTSSIYFVLANSMGTGTSNFIANPTSNNLSINVSGMPLGVYTLTMVCDGAIVDTKSVQIQ